MKNRGNALLLTAMVGAVVAVTGCVGYPAHRGGVYAAPPYAPENGYRQSYYGHDLRYDGSLGVYLILDRPHHYYYRDNYYRYDAGRWYYTRDLNKRWRSYDERKLPPGLAKKYGHDDRGRDRKRDYHP